MYGKKKTAKKGSKRHLGQELLRHVNKYLFYRWTQFEAGGAVFT